MRLIQNINNRNFSKNFSSSLATPKSGKTEKSAINQINNFYLESYSYPKYFFEIDKNFSKCHEKDFNWILHIDKDIKETFQSTFRQLKKDYHSFKEYKK